MQGLIIIPDEVKAGVLVLFLTPGERVALALTCRGESRWMRPILAFMALPVAKKITLLRRGGGVNGGVVLEALNQCHDHVALMSLLGQSESEWGEGVRVILENRIRDRAYRKLIKKTLTRMYLEHMIRHNEDVGRFLKTIKSPEVLSQAIEQHVLLQKDKLTDEALRGWAARIPDALIRHRVFCFLNQDS